MKIDFSWIVAFQILLYGIITCLHITLCMMRYRNQVLKLAASVLFHLILAAVVVKFYFLRAYHDYGVTLHTLAIPFTKTGIKYVDKMNSRALGFMPFILVGFFICYFILSKCPRFVRFFGYAESKLISRAILITTIICATIDLLVTRVFIIDDDAIIIFQAIAWLVYAMVMWNVVYLPLAIYMLSRTDERTKRDVDGRGGKKQLEASPAPPNDNPYSYH